jgi:hypothetical protein
MKKNVESDENIVRFMILCLKLVFLVLKLSEITFSSFWSVGFLTGSFWPVWRLKKQSYKKKKGKTLNWRGKVSNRWPLYNMNDRQPFGYMQLLLKCFIELIINSNVICYGKKITRKARNVLYRLKKIKIAIK